LTLNDEIIIYYYLQINENGKLIEENTFEYCDCVTTDANHCKKIVSGCMEKGNRRIF